MTSIKSHPFGSGNNKGNLAAVGLVVILAAIEHHSFPQNLILTWYQDHTAGQTGRLEGGRDLGGGEGRQYGREMPHTGAGKKKENHSVE